MVTTDDDRSPTDAWLADFPDALLLTSGDRRAPIHCRELEVLEVSEDAVLLSMRGVPLEFHSLMVSVARNQAAWPSQHELLYALDAVVRTGGRETPMPCVLVEPGEHSLDRETYDVDVRVTLRRVLP